MNNGQFDGANIHVDTTTNHTQFTGTTTSILNARSQTSDMIAQQKSSLLSVGKELSDYSAQIDNLIHKINQLDSDTKKALNKTSEYKQLEASAKKLLDTQAQILQTYESGNATAKDLNDLYYNSQAVLLDTRDTLSDINDIYDEGNNKLRDQNTELSKQRAMRKVINEDTKRHLKEQQKEQQKALDEANKSVAAAIGNVVGSIGSGIQGLLDTFNIDKIRQLSEAGTRSALTTIQEDLQRAYGINKEGFNQFKSDVYDSIDTRLYSSEEVLKVYGDLLNVGLGNQETATKQFNTLLQGQSLLGLTSETQSKLIALGNKTGRDQLTFTTNRVAQYMKTATNLSKDQLNELVSINANTAQEMADMGVDSEAFNSMLNDTTVALNNAMGGDDTMSSNLRSAITNSMNVDTAASVYGLTTEQLRDMYNRGTSWFDIVESGGGIANRLLQVYRSQGEAAGDRESTYLRDGGAIPEEVANIIRQQYLIEKQTGKSVQQLIQEQRANPQDDSALEDREAEREAMLNDVQKTINQVTNGFYEKFDWNTVDTISKSMTVIVGLLQGISALLSSQMLNNAFSSIGNFFTGKGTGTSIKSIKTAFSTKGIKGGFSALGKGLNNGVAALGKKVFMPLAFVSMATDGLFGAGETARAMYGEDASFGETVGSGFISALSGGSSVSTKIVEDKKGNKTEKVDVGGTTLSGLGSGALTGASIGAAFGLPGLAIGAGIGAIAGGIAGWFKGSKAEETQEKQLKAQQKQLEEQEKIAENTAKTSDTLTDLRLVGNSYTSYIPRAAIGGASSPTDISYPSARPKITNALGIGGGAFTGAKGQKLGPWLVTSAWGPRILNGKKNNHNGIDLSKGGTQHIYASMPGVVSLLNQPKGLGTAVKVSDGNYDYYYGHMRSRAVKNGDVVSSGTELGIMGSTGASTGQHLHFQVNPKGAQQSTGSINPVPWATDSLWNGKPGTGPTSSSSSGDLDDTTNSSDVSSLANSLYQSYSSNVGGSTSSSGATSSPSFSDVVSGLSQINQTLIDLSNRQTQQEAIMSMLSRSPRPEVMMD